MNGSMPLVSIVIPVYNAESFLNSCLDSVVGQKYTNIEILLINDGSTDQSGAICNQYAERDCRVHVFHKENGGQASARNLGLLKAKGAFICFVDSDDIISRRFVDLLLNTCLSNNSDVVYSDIQLFKDHPVFDDDSCDEVKGVSYEKKDILAKYASISLKESIPVISCCNKLYKKSVLENFCFPEGMVYEDTASMFKIFDQSLKTTFINAPLYAYRLNSDSTTIHQFEKRNLDVLKAYDQPIGFFLDKGESNIASYFYRPWILHGLFCWWGARFVLKNRKLSCEILDECKKKRKDLFSISERRFFPDYILAVLVSFPILYAIYRRLMPGLVGDR